MRTPFPLSAACVLLLFENYVVHDMVRASAVCSLLNNAILFVSVSFGPIALCVLIMYDRHSSWALIHLWGPFPYTFELFG